MALVKGRNIEMYIFFSSRKHFVNKLKWGTYNHLGFYIFHDSTFQEIYFLRRKPRLQSNKTMQVRFLFFLATKMPYLTSIPVRNFNS